jgi:hypothetical protein
MQTKFAAIALRYTNFVQNDIRRFRFRVGVD